MERVDYRNIVEEVRELCIRNRWFESGSCSEYEALFAFIRANAKLEGIGHTLGWFCREITWRIVDCTPKQTHENVMFAVVRAIAPYYFEY